MIIELWRKGVVIDELEHHAYITIKPAWTLLSFRYEVPIIGFDTQRVYKYDRNVISLPIKERGLVIPRNDHRPIGVALRADHVPVMYSLNKVIPITDAPLLSMVSMVNETDSIYGIGLL